MMDRSGGYVQGQKPTETRSLDIPTPWGCKAAADVVRSSHSVTGHFLFTARGRRFGATRLRSGYWQPPKSLAHPTRRCLANAGSAHKPGRQGRLVLPLYQFAGRRYLLPNQNAQAATNAASTTAPTIRGRDSPAPVGGGKRLGTGTTAVGGWHLAGEGHQDLAGQDRVQLSYCRHGRSPGRLDGQAAAVTVGRFSLAIGTLGARGAGSGRSRRVLTRVATQSRSVAAQRVTVCAKIRRYGGLAWPAGFGRLQP